jgi:hypothetical protein
MSPPGTALLLLLLLLMAPATQAQRVPSPSRINWELRADGFPVSPRSAQISGGVQARSGNYVRLALLGGAGRVWRDGSARAIGRLEVHARFHLDPFRQSALGAYGLGGLASSWESRATWEPRLVLGIGVELPTRARTRWAVEAALAGGLRLSAVLRRGDPFSR